MRTSFLPPVNANNFTMVENAGLAAMAGDIIVNTVADAQLQALSAGEQISVQANVIDIRNAMTAKGITLTGNNSVDVIGTLDALENIDLHAIEGI